MGKVDDLAMELNTTMAQLTEKVATMESANSETSARLDRLTIAVEALVANQRAGLSNRNNFTTTSADVREVRNANPPEPGENRSLGYRNGTGSVLANLNGIWRKIDMPYLDGSDPYIWITLAERFFRLGNYTDTERLDLLPISLQGPALQWFNIEMARDPFKDWAEFKRRMRARFGTIRKQSHSEMILKKDSISEVVQATKLSCAVESTTSLEVEASGICVKATMQVAKQIKAPIVEEIQNKSRDGVSTGMKTCGVNDLTSSEKRKLIPSMVLDEIKGEEKVEMSQDWTCISNMNGAHKLFEIAFYETEQITTKKKQRKCFKSWRFKFKKKSRTSEVEISRSLLMKHHVFSLMKCWKYGVSVWHCWRFKFTQRKHHKTLSRPALILADGRDKRFLQSFSGLEFWVFKQRRLESLTLKLHLLHSETTAQRDHFSIWHCWKHKPLQHVWLWERDLTFILGHIHMRNQLTLAQELHIKGIIVLYVFLQQVCHGLYVWLWVTDFELRWKFRVFSNREELAMVGKEDFKFQGQAETEQTMLKISFDEENKNIQLRDLKVQKVRFTWPVELERALIWANALEIHVENFYRAYILTSLGHISDTCIIGCPEPMLQHTSEASGFHIEYTVGTKIKRDSLWQPHVSTRRLIVQLMTPVSCGGLRQGSFSIWHRWRSKIYHSCTSAVMGMRRHQFIGSETAVLSFQLEDKLFFEKGGIDR